jgi:molybdopterin synthase catalytic subunit
MASTPISEGPASKPPDDATSLTEGPCHVSLTRSLLRAQPLLDRVRSPAAGATVLFAGTTRDNFAGKPVTGLTYSSYPPRALRSMLAVCRDVAAAHGALGIAMVHRLGPVPVGEESILIAVSTPHRQAAWRAGEEALERCKEKVEIWKMEEFGGGEPGVWRANRDGAVGKKVIVGGAVPEEAETGRPGKLLERGHGPVVHER